MGANQERYEPLGPRTHQVIRREQKCMRLIGTAAAAAVAAAAAAALQGDACTSDAAAHHHNRDILF